MCDHAIVANPVDPAAGDDLVHLHSSASVAATVDLVREAAQARGAQVFSVIDHAAAASSVGMRMPATQVVIVGNPKVGTALMLSAPDLALDLPTRVLVRESPSGCEVVLHDPFPLAARCGLSEEQTQLLAGMADLVRRAIAERVG